MARRPWYVSTSARTTSPGRVRAARATKSACCAPTVTSTCSGRTRRPVRASQAAPAARWRSLPAGAR
jgi:hypothetical protein